jgi:hypothetical protein
VSVTTCFRQLLLSSCVIHPRTRDAARPVVKGVNLSLNGLEWVCGIVSVPPQKFSAIQTLLSIVGAGIVTYFPSREGTAQLGQTLFTCQS